MGGVLVLLEVDETTQVNTLTVAYSTVLYTALHSALHCTQHDTAHSAILHTIYTERLPSTILHTGIACTGIACPPHGIPVHCYDMEIQSLSPHCFV